jgi:hypothetical protein
VHYPRKQAFTASGVWQSRAIRIFKRLLHHRNDQLPLGSRAVEVAEENVLPGAEQKLTVFSFLEEQ